MVCNWCFSQICRMCPCLHVSSLIPIVRLPEAVLLQVLKGIHDPLTRQAAYQSCRDIRDLCNDYMKTVTVQICPGRTWLGAKEYSSKTVCPHAAFEIKKLIIYFSSYTCFMAPAGDFNYDDAFQLLEQLSVDALTSDNTHKHCRSQQLAESSPAWICICLEAFGRIRFLQWKSGIARYYQMCCQRFPQLESLFTDIPGLMAHLHAPRLQQLFLRCSITPEQLREFANKHPNIQQLELTVEHRAQLNAYLPALLKLTGLTHLSINSRGRASLPADLLVGLTQLSNLGLRHIDINDPHSLTELHIKHLTLGSVSVRKPEGQQHAADWVALECVNFRGDAQMSETLARAILQLPRPGFNVIWPSVVYYDADAEPSPQFRFLGAAHMQQIDELHLTGRHIKFALRALVNSKVMVRKLYVDAEIETLGVEDVASCLAFPDVVEMELDTRIADAQEMYRQLFKQCQKLKTLCVSKEYIPSA